MGANAIRPYNNAFQCDSLFKHQIIPWGRMQFDPTTMHFNAIHNLNIKSRRGELNSPYHDTDKFILSQNHPFANSLNKTFFHILEIQFLPKKGECNSPLHQSSNNTLRGNMYHVN
jgi:hypothetical protein